LIMKRNLKTSKKLKGGLSEFKSKCHPLCSYFYNFIQFVWNFK
jgi:hypothetical protein